MLSEFVALTEDDELLRLALPPECVRPTAAKAAVAELDCLEAFDLRCLVEDTVVDDEDDELAAFMCVVILMLVADVDDAVAFMVESISFSDDDPESEEVSWVMGL